MIINIEKYYSDIICPSFTHEAVHADRENELANADGRVVIEIMTTDMMVKMRASRRNFAVLHAGNPKDLRFIESHLNEDFMASKRVLWV